MTTFSRTPLIAALLLITTLLTACGSDDGDPAETESGPMGTMSIDITDAPLDEASHLFVRITGLELKPQNGKSLDFIFCNRHLIQIDEECLNQTIHELDLMTLTGKVSQALSDKRIMPAQQYNWIRLKLDEANPGHIKLAATGDTEYPLTIPSGAQTGLKINTQLTIQEGHDLRLTIDFDLRKSVHKAGDDYILRPTLRLVDNSHIGHLSGTIDPFWIPAETCSPAVYLSEYSPPAEPVFGLIDIADDLHPENSALITTTYPVYNEESGIYEYEIGFIPEGDYVAAFTCNAIDDQLENNDEINFFPQLQTQINAGEENTLNFLPLPL